MGSYRKHPVSKAARKAHKKREMKRKKQLSGLAAFTYSSSVGRTKKQLSPRRHGRIG